MSAIVLKKTPSPGQGRRRCIKTIISKTFDEGYEIMGSSAVGRHDRQSRRRQGASSGEMEEKAQRINCSRCAHFYVTWDEHFPRGCRALAFKSREAPSAVVLRSSGIECQMFEEKKARRGPRKA